MPIIKDVVRLSRPKGKLSSDDKKWIMSMTALNDMTEDQRHKLWREFWKSKRESSHVK